MFGQLIGNEPVKKILRRFINGGRVPNSLLFAGQESIGKRRFALEFARAFICLNRAESGEACGRCRSCLRAERFTFPKPDDRDEHKKVIFSEHPDIGTVIPYKRNILVDAVRDLEREANFRPFEAAARFFIIDEADKMNPEAANALLKTLEEPPPRVAFVMATTELHKVPDTILSRCQEFQFRTIPLKKIYDRLKLIAEAENINIADGALREIARSGEGSMRDAQSNFDQVISFSGDSIEIADVISALGVASTEMLTSVVRAIADGTPAVALQTVDELVSRGQDLRSFCRDLLSLFRDLLMAKMAGDAEHLFDSALMSIEELKKLAGPFSESDLIRFFNSLSETESKLRDATQPRYQLEIGLVKLIEMRRLVPLEQIIERLAKLESALGGSSLPQTETDGRAKTPETAGAAVEKKKLAVDFAAEEVPFPVSEKAVSSFGFKVSSPETADLNEVAAQSPQTVPVSSEPENGFSPAPKSEAEEKAEDQAPKTETPNLKPDLLEIIANMPSKLPPISSEDLEHVEDAWLDAAYEAKLQRLGDDLFPIKNASQLVKELLGPERDDGVTAAVESSNGGSATAAAPARKTPVIEIPVFETEDETVELPALSDNPTEEELWRYAESHPLTRKLIRIFRGKLVEVKKL